MPDYRVGPGRPPKHSQFRKGASGNPKGRPKGSLNVATVLARALRERVVITENGRRRKITKLEASFKQLVNKAATGDMNAIKLLAALAHSSEEQAVEHASGDAQPLKEVDQKLLQDVLKRFGNQKETEDIPK